MFAVFSAVSGLELVVSKTHHQCESVNLDLFLIFMNVYEQVWRILILILYPIIDKLVQSSV